MQKYKLSVNSPNNLLNKTTQNDSLPMEWMKLKVGKCLSPDPAGNQKPVPVISQTGAKMGMN